MLFWVQILNGQFYELELIGTTEWRNVVYHNYVRN